MLLLITTAIRLTTSPAASILRRFVLDTAHYLRHFHPDCRHLAQPAQSVHVAGMGQF